jgi:AraC-like DNA-binding protein
VTAPPSLRISTIGYVFQVLRVGATLWDGKKWWPVHFQESQNHFEVQHARESERDPYNARSLQEAWRGKKPVHGRHAGLHDMFVPVQVQGRVQAVLVTGPFLIARSTSAEILERWRWLTSRQGHPGDPEFAHYLSITLGTLVLEGPAFATYQRLLSSVARLMVGEGPFSALEKEVDDLCDELAPARFVDRMWETAQSMVDDRTTRVWSSPNFAPHLALLSIQRVPDHALVGLAASRQTTSDPVDDAVRRDAFQRACVEVARRSGDVVTGRVGDHGVMFLSAFTGTKERRRQRIEQLMDRVSAVARKDYGLALHFGSSALASSARLSASYQDALGAAESALTQGIRMVSVKRGSPRERSPLWKLRHELVGAAEERAAAMPSRFERYAEAVAMHSGHRIDLARAQLDAGFETVAKEYVKSGALDQKSFGEMCDALDRAAAEASTVSDVFSAYRRAMADMAAAVEKPVLARQDRSLRRAVEYIHQRYSEPLSAPKVASVAGFAPKYFSYLFRRREKMTFEDYLRRVRIERARQLLVSTDLNLARVAELSGFRSAQYFCHVFRDTGGVTPTEFRERARSLATRRARPRTNGRKLARM